MQDGFHIGPAERRARSLGEPDDFEREFIRRAARPSRRLRCKKKPRCLGEAPSRADPRDSLDEPIVRRSLERSCGNGFAALYRGRKFSRIDVLAAAQMVQGEGGLDILHKRRTEGAEQLDRSGVWGATDDATPDIRTDRVDLGWGMAEMDHLSEHEVDTDALAFSNLQECQGVSQRRVGRPRRVREQVGGGHPIREPSRRHDLGYGACRNRHDDR